MLAVLAFALNRFFPANTLQHIISRSFGVIMVVNLFLNTLFYPELFQYQSGSEAAGFLNTTKPDEAYMFNMVSSEYSFQFYYKGNLNG